MPRGRAGRNALVLDPAEMVQNIQAFASLSVERVVISPCTGEAQEMTQALGVIVRDVMPVCV